MSPGWPALAIAACRNEIVQEVLVVRSWDALAYLNHHTAWRLVGQWADAEQQAHE